MATPAGGGPSGMSQVTAQQYRNPAFVGDAGSSSSIRREPTTHKEWRQNSGGSTSSEISLNMQSVRKPGRSYRAGGQLHHGNSGYFKHPYGNRLNFLEALLAGEWDQDKTSVGAPQIAPSKLVIWLAFCLFMVLIAGTIIFASVSSRAGNEKGNINNSADFQSNSSLLMEGVSDNSIQGSS